MKSEAQIELPLLFDEVEPDNFGQLPSGWEIASLGEIADVQGGLAKGKKRTSGTELLDVPYLRVANVQRGYLDLVQMKTITATTAEVDNLRLLAGDVLFNEGGDRDKLGRGWIWNNEIDDCIHQNHVFRARILENAIIPKLLSWYGNSVGAEYFMREGKQTTNLASLNKTKLRALPVVIPPVNEQQRMVEAVESHLSRLDDAVATLERVERNLKRYRASVLKSAVEGRLVPTQAELAKQAGNKGYESADVLLLRILKKRRQRWEQAELAKMEAKGKPPKDDKWKAKYKEPAAPDTADLSELPEGWCWATWSQIGFSQNGQAFPSKEYQDTGVRLLRPGNLHASGRVRWTAKNTRHMPESWEAEHPGHVVGANELVMNLTAQSLADDFLGRICLTGPDEHCLLNQRIARLTPVLISERFLLWLFKSPLFRRYVESLNTGSLIQHMFTSQLAEFTFPLPPLSEQKRIAEEVERQMGIAEAVEKQAHDSRIRSQRLRQSVLKWAFEGKLADQDPNDEPAAVLLERIKAEREAAKPEKKAIRQKGGGKKVVKA